GTFRIEVSLPDHPALRSGQLGEVEIPRPAAASARAPLVVPATALFAARAGEGFVWRLDPASGTVRATLVRVGAVTADGVVIEAGLAPGDRIVLTGVDRLTEGARVRVSAGPRA
ncbi:MAG: efflux transporter periplasmic adaptor subunit, partial [Elioraea tepidiphila]